MGPVTIQRIENHRQHLFPTFLRFHHRNVHHFVNLHCTKQLSQMVLCNVLDGLFFPFSRFSSRSIYCLFIWFVIKTLSDNQITLTVHAQRHLYVNSNLRRNYICVEFAIKFSMAVHYYA